MTGEMVSSKDAIMGLAGLCRHDRRRMEKAMQIADQLAEGAPIAIAASKAGINVFAPSRRCRDADKPANRRSEHALARLQRGRVGLSRKAQTEFQGQINDRL